MIKMVSFFFIEVGEKNKTKGVRKEKHYEIDCRRDGYGWLVPSSMVIGNVFKIGGTEYKIISGNYYSLSEIREYSEATIYEEENEEDFIHVDKYFVVFNNQETYIRHCKVVYGLEQAMDVAVSI